MVLMRYRPTLCSHSSGFTLLEVMLAALILAVGILTAMGTIASNNSFRKTLDENAVADLVLRQMATRLQNTDKQFFGHIYTTPDTATPPKQDQGWTLQLRATNAVFPKNNTDPAVDIPRADRNNPPFNKALNPNGPFRPLTQQDLIDARILATPLQIKDLELYVEYYNLKIVDPGTSGIGLISLYSDNQNGLAANKSPRQLWLDMVGDPSRLTGDPDADKSIGPVNPTSSLKKILLPAVFNLTDSNPTKQIRDAALHGLVIRILVSWISHEVANVPNPPRRWRETIILKSF